MKKTQVALAALALVASTAALADVKISGVMDVGVGTYTGKGSYIEQGGWADHSSITISAAEELTNGFAGFVTLEAGFDQNGNYANGGNGNLFSRQALVGLKSAELGTVSLGQQLSPFILAQALTNQGVGNFWVNRAIMAGGFDTAAVAGTNGGFFLKNSFQYTSPTIAGFTAYGLVSKNTGAAAGTLVEGNNDKYSSFALNGSIAGVNLWLANQEAADVGYKSWTLGGSYGLTEELAVSANYINHKNSAGDKIGSYALGASYKVAPAVTLVAQYARNDLDSAQSLTNVGANYAFSKRTSAYVTYVRATNGAISSLGDRGNYATTGTANNNTVVGIVHNF